MFKPKLGVSFRMIAQSFSAEALNALAKSKIATLEVRPENFAGFNAPAPRAVCDALDKLGIRIASLHANDGPGFDICEIDEGRRKEAVEAQKGAVELAAGIGAEFLVLHTSSDRVEPAERSARLQQARVSLAALAEKGQQAGVRICVEYLPRACLGNTLDELLTLLAAPRTGACLDTNHQMGRFRELPHITRALGPRLFTLHISDYDGIDEKHLLPGKGVVDWPGFLRALKDIDYQGPFNYEALPEGATPAERIASFEKNFAWLMRMGAD